MKTALTLLIYLAGLQVSVVAQKMSIHYMPPTEELDFIKTYNLTLLELALEKTKAKYGDYEIITKTDSDLAQQNALKSLNEQKEIYVVPTMTDAVRERVFIPVRIPLYKGLFGIRLLMIHKDEQLKLDNTRAESELKKLTFVQGSEWPDTQILKSNGFNLKTFNTKSEMISAIVSKSAQAYPRSLVEIWNEIDLEKGKPLSVQNTVYLYYPTAIYFFLQRSIEGKRVADRIEEGLTLAINDGSFDATFKKYMSATLKQAKLDSKKLVKLTNQNLPAQTPLTDKRLWFIN